MVRTGDMIAVLGDQQIRDRDEQAPGRTRWRGGESGSDTPFWDSIHGRFGAGIALGDDMSNQIVVRAADRFRPERPF